MKALVFGWLIITIATRSACTERALDYRGDDGMVVITPDWSSFASPSSACYRFYRADDGKKVNYGTDMFASAEYFSVVLPVGDYHCLRTIQIRMMLLLLDWKRGVWLRFALFQACSRVIYIVGMWTMWISHCRVRCDIRLFHAGW